METRKYRSICQRKLKEKSDYRIVDQDFCNIHFKDRIKLLPFEYYVFDMIYAYKDRKNFLAANNLLNKPYYYSLEEQMSGYYSAKIIYSTFRAAGFPWQKIVYLRQDICGKNI